MNAKHKMFTYLSTYLDQFLKHLLWLHAGAVEAGKELLGVQVLHKLTKEVAWLNTYLEIQKIGGQLWSFFTKLSINEPSVAPPASPVPTPLISLLTFVWIKNKSCLILHSGQKFTIYSNFKTFRLQSQKIKFLSFENHDLVTFIA